jgi:hypothetical protein
MPTVIPPPPYPSQDVAPPVTLSSTHAPEAEGGISSPAIRAQILGISAEEIVAMDQQPLSARQARGGLSLRQNLDEVLRELHRRKAANDSLQGSIRPLLEKTVIALALLYYSTTGERPPLGLFSPFVDAGSCVGTTRLMSLINGLSTTADQIIRESVDQLGASAVSSHAALNQDSVGPSVDPSQLVSSVLSALDDMTELPGE